jgi:hypothetical protein
MLKQLVEGEGNYSDATNYMKTKDVQTRGTKAVQAAKAFYERYPSITDINKKKALSDWMVSPKQSYDQPLTYYSQTHVLRQVKGLVEFIDGRNQE